MKKVILLILLISGCSFLNQPVFYLGGIQVNEADHNEWIDSLKREGMNTIPVTVYAHQGDWDSDSLWWDKEAPSVINEIRTAKKAGLKVVFILRVALDHAFERNEFLWHGMIMPKSEQLINNWFKHYTEFATKWAKIAEQEGVDVLGVGSEMNSLTSTIPLEALPSLEEYFLDQEQQTKRIKQIAKLAGPKSTLQKTAEKRNNANLSWAKQVGRNVDEINQRRKLLENNWRMVIKEVRKAYDGKLTYAANFDQYHEVNFWDDLDYIGINAYFQLREPDTELYPSLVKGWREVTEDIKYLQTTKKLEDIPIIFTELGYTFRENSTIAPWAGSGFALIGTPENQRLFLWKEQPINYKERTLALRALHEVITKEELQLQGILYWKFSTKDYHRDVEPFVAVLEDELDKDFLIALRAFTH